MTPFGELVGDGSPPLSEFKSQVTSIIPEIDLLMSSRRAKDFHESPPTLGPARPRFCEGERPSGGGRGERDDEPFQVAREESQGLTYRRSPITISHAA